jgi:hypothetical protein
MFEECVGCVIYNIYLERDDYIKPLSPRKCPGSLDILISKCPCKKCLVKVTCKDGCDHFKRNSVGGSEGDL